MAETINETETGAAETTATARNARKVREGLVVSNKMDKTAVVAVERSKRHPLYGRVQRVTKKFKAHDEANQCNEGDRVRIVETRPISKDKCWRVLEILEKAK
jgi:small subunit ribosomal protein S17